MAASSPASAAAGRESRAQTPETGVGGRRQSRGSAGRDGTASDIPREDLNSGGQIDAFTGRLEDRHEVAIATYELLAARSRGARVHPGPSEALGPSRAVDRHQWQEADKTQRPYSFFDSPAAHLDQAPGVPERAIKRRPPNLWWPATVGELAAEKRQQAKLLEKLQRAEAQFGSSSESSDDKEVETASPKKGAKSKKKQKKRKERLVAEKLAQELAERQQQQPKVPPPGTIPWDDHHYVMASRMNHEVHMQDREFFDKPMYKDREIHRERCPFVMSDRQCRYNDEPAPPGEPRHTIMDYAGPTRRLQIPSYWSRIKDWRAYSHPELPNVSVSGTFRGGVSLLEALADTPAKEAKTFWHNWAEDRAKYPCTAERQARTWDHSFALLESRTNPLVYRDSRIYFSVPQGTAGRSFGRKTDSPAPTRRRRRATDSSSAIGAASSAPGAKRMGRPSAATTY